MYKYYTKVFRETAFENVADWLNSFTKPEELSHSEYNMVIEDYSLLHGHQATGAMIVITIRIFIAVPKKHSEYKTIDGRPVWITKEEGKQVNVEPYTHQDENYSNLCASVYCRCKN